MTELEAKVVTVGSYAVGKTSILHKYIHGTFDERNVRTTIGGAYVGKTVKVGNRNVMLGIWDTAGQDRFRSMAPMYCRGAHAALLVFDVSDPASLPSLADWMEEIDQSTEPILVCVGNKCDMREEADTECIPKSDGLKYAETIGATYFETSAKTGTGISEVFTHLAEQLIKKDITLKSSEPGSIIDFPEDNTTPNTGCCG